MCMAVMNEFPVRNASTGTDCLVIAGKMAQNFPVRTQQWRGNVSGITTDFISSLYADRLMVVATQVGALGTIQSAKYALFPSPFLIACPPSSAAAALTEHSRPSSSLQRAMQGRGSA